MSLENLLNGTPWYNLQVDGAPVIRSFFEFDRDTSVVRLSLRTGRGVISLVGSTSGSGVPRLIVTGSLRTRGSLYSITVI